jgi:HSP20 family protein
MQREDTIIVELDLPLVRKQDIRLRLLDEGLEVAASLQRCLRFEGWGTVQRTCEFSSFYHIIPLPESVTAQGATASFQKGILRVELKKKQAQQHLIPIE